MYIQKIFLLGTGYSLQDLQNPGICTSLLKHNANQVHPEGEPAYTLGKYFLDYFHVEIKGKCIGVAEN